MPRRSLFFLRTTIRGAAFLVFGLGAILNAQAHGGYFGGGYRGGFYHHGFYPGGYYGGFHPYGYGGFYRPYYGYGFYRPYYGYGFGGFGGLGGLGGLGGVGGLGGLGLGGYGLGGYGTYLPYYGGGYGYVANPVVTAPNSYANASTPDNAAHLQLVVPDNAVVIFDGERTNQTGSVREFVSPPLAAGSSYTYRISVRYTAANGKPVNDTRPIHVRANDWFRIDFTKPAPPEPLPRPD